MSKYLISVALLLSLGTLKTAVLGDIVSPSTYPVEPLTYDSSLLNESAISDNKSIEVLVTAYSSRETETDDTPLITASGTTVRPGVVAANWLPLGTKVRIPEVFGDQVFTVEDRMHQRNSHKLDVWFPSTADALRFGVRRARVEIL